MELIKFGIVVDRKGFTPHLSWAPLLVKDPIFPIFATTSNPSSRHCWGGAGFQALQKDLNFKTVHDFLLHLESKNGSVGTQPSIWHMIYNSQATMKRVGWGVLQMLL
jgi:hypothetical protein